jgi:SH3-like domain-containing protein
LSLTWSVFTFSFASSQKSKLTHRNTAIITAPTVTVKGSPSETGTELFIIHEGLKVKLTDSLGAWKEIQLADGNKGWVQDSTMVRI